MENGIQVFSAETFGSVRVIENAGELFFVAKDVAEALGYTWNGAPRIAHVPEEWRGVTSVVTQRAVKPRPSGGGYKAHLNWTFCL